SFASHTAPPATSTLSLHDALPILQGVRGTHRVTDQEPEQKYQAVERFTRDLTELARKGKIDPVIGRDEEIRRVMQVLSRRTKNRSEEHTSELQSLRHLVCRLLLEK